EYDLGPRVQGCDVDHLGVRKLGLQLFDPALDEALLLAGRVVLGILLQIAMRPGFRDRVDDRRALDRLELLELGAQALRALGCDGCLHEKVLAPALGRPCCSGWMIVRTSGRTYATGSGGAVQLRMQLLQRPD